MHELRCAGMHAYFSYMCVLIYIQGEGEEGRRQEQDTKRGARNSKHVKMLLGKPGWRLYGLSQMHLFHKFNYFQINTFENWVVFLKFSWPWDFHLWSHNYCHLGTQMPEVGNASARRASDSVPGKTWHPLPIWNMPTVWRTLPITEEGHQAPKE